MSRLFVLEVKFTIVPVLDGAGSGFPVNVCGRAARETDCDKELNGRSKRCAPNAKGGRADQNQSWRHIDFGVDLRDSAKLARLPQKQLPSLASPNRNVSNDALCPFDRHVSYVGYKTLHVQLTQCPYAGANGHKLLPVRTVKD